MQSCLTVLILNNKQMFHFKNANKLHTHNYSQMHKQFSYQLYCDGKSVVGTCISSSFFCPPSKMSSTIRTFISFTIMISSATNTQTQTNNINYVHVYTHNALLQYSNI